jgi:hypothetical protein
MNKRPLLLLAFFGASQLVLANIATDFANGVEPVPATEGARSEGVVPEDAVAQLIAEGVDSAEAVKIVNTVYGLTEDCGLSQGNAVTQMTEAGVPQELAVDVVSNRCGDGDCEQTVAPIDSVIVAALEASPEGADTVPLVALFSSCGVGALAGQSPPPAPTPGAGGGGGTSVSPN